MTAVYVLTVFCRCDKTHYRRVKATCSRVDWGVTPFAAMPHRSFEVKFYRIQNLELIHISNTIAKCYFHFIYTHIHEPAFFKKQPLEREKNNLNQCEGMPGLERNLLQTNDAAEHLNTRFLPLHSCRCRTLFRLRLKRGRFTAVGVVSEYKLEQSFKIWISLKRHKHPDEKNMRTIHFHT